MKEYPGNKKTEVEEKIIQDDVGRRKLLYMA